MAETTTPHPDHPDHAPARVIAYLDALDHERATLAGRKHFFVDGRIEERHGADGNTHVLYRGDLRSLLADLAVTRASYLAMQQHADALAADRDQLRRQLDAAEAAPCDHDSTAFEALERLHARIHRDFNFDAAECAPPTQDEPALRMMDNLVMFADEVYLPLADAAAKHAEVTETRTEWATRQRHPDDTEEPTDPVSESMARMRVAKYPWHTALLSREVRYGPWTEAEPVPPPCRHPEPRRIIGGVCGDCTIIPELTPNPLEAAVTEALADIANDDQAEPEPAPTRPPWLVEAGDD